MHAQSPITTLRELIETAKANKGKLNYASAGPGNTSHLAVELFKMTVGVDMTHVPYKGSGPAITAILGREVDLMFDAVGSSLPQIQAGKFRAIAVTTAMRSAVLPNVPTTRWSARHRRSSTRISGRKSRAGRESSEPRALLRSRRAAVTDL